jgi:hypothetical protein
MAGFTTTAKNQALTALVSNAAPTNQWTWFSIHTGDPGTNGANEVTGGGYARVQTTWGAAAGSQITGSQVTFNIPGAGTQIQYWGIWTLVSGGVFGFGEALPQNQTYGSPGLYFLTVTLTATG